MKTLVIDFETYYSKDYSLSKMSTEEYIRSPLYETILVAVKEDDNPTEWFSGTHEDTKKWLNKFAWDKAAAVAHNAAFDMAILNWRFDIRPKRIIDTLSMGRALYGGEVGVGLASLAKFANLGEKGHEVINALGKRRVDFNPTELRAYASYCVNDVELTHKLLTYMVGEFPVSELKLIDMTIRMFSEPVFELDLPLLEKHLKEVREKKENLLSKAMVDKKDIMSNPKFAEILRNCGVEPPTKISKTTGKETYAFAKTDEEFLALQEHENFLVQLLVNARLGGKSTLEESRTERFIGVAKRGLLPVALRFYGAHTGRFSADGDKLNMQNLPRGSNLKKAIRAPNGYRVVDCDSSSIEARMLAWLAGQEDLVAAFERGEDVYKLTGTKIYNVPIEEIDKDRRFLAKTVTLGSGYGTGWRKLQAHLKVQKEKVVLSDSEAQRIIAAYRESYSAIPKFWKQCDEMLETMVRDQYKEFGPGGIIKVIGLQGILLPNGMRLKYPNLRKHVDADGKKQFVYDSRKGRTTFPKSIWGGGLTENLCQALARIVVMDQMLEIAKRYRVALSVHDSTVCVVPENEVKEAVAYIEACMKMRPKWGPDLPISCESKSGPTYGG